MAVFLKSYAYPNKLQNKEPLETLHNCIQGTKPQKWAAKDCCESQMQQEGSKSTEEKA